MIVNNINILNHCWMIQMAFNDFETTFLQIPFFFLPCTWLTWVYSFGLKRFYEIGSLCSVHRVACCQWSKDVCQASRLISGQLLVFKHFVSTVCRASLLFREMMSLLQKAADVINTNLCVGRTYILVGEADNKQMICFPACQMETGLWRNKADSWRLRLCVRWGLKLKAKVTFSKSWWMKKSDSCIYLGKNLLVRGNDFCRYSDGLCFAYSRNIYGFNTSR